MSESDSDDENPLMEESSTLANTSSLMVLFFSCHGAHELSPAWAHSLRTSLRRGRQWSVSFVNEASATWCRSERKWRVFMSKFVANGNNISKGGSRQRQRNFRYDPSSYALNFDDGSRNENENNECNVPRGSPSRRFAFAFAKSRSRKAERL